MHKEAVNWRMRAKVIKYEPDTMAYIKDRFGVDPDQENVGLALRHLEAKKLITPDDVLYVPGNGLTTVGAQRVSDLLTSNTPKPFSAAWGVAGVGTSTTAFSTAQTALLGTAYYQGLDSAPGSANGVITAYSTFTGSNANHAWEEWCWAIATATPVASTNFNTATTTGTMLNRKAQSMGTKVSTAVWTLAAQATIAS
jgi:hypothetical protein